MEEVIVMGVQIFTMARFNMSNRWKLLLMELQLQPSLLQTTIITDHLQRNLPTVHQNLRMDHQSLLTKHRRLVMDLQVSPHMKPQNQVMMLLSLVTMPQNQVITHLNQVIIPRNQAMVPQNQVTMHLFLVLHFMVI